MSSQAATASQGEADLLVEDYDVDAAPLELF
jgi:hypothetical protein